MTQEIAKIEEQNKLALAKVKEQKLEIRELKAKIEDLTITPELRAKEAQLRYDLKMAREFATSKAFPNYNEHQIYVIMKAGEESGMSAIKALNTFYIVNGRIAPHSSNMVGILTEKGYKMTYKEGEEEGVKFCDITATKGEEIIHERVKANDKELEGSKAMGFAPNNRLRFHAVRKILTFHLPHLIGGGNPEFDWQDTTTAVEIMNNENTFQKSSTGVMNQVDVAKAQQMFGAPRLETSAEIKEEVQDVVINDADKIEFQEVTEQATPIEDNDDVENLMSM